MTSSHTARRLFAYSALAGAAGFILPAPSLAQPIVDASQASVTQGAASTPSATISAGGAAVAAVAVPNQSDEIRPFKYRAADKELMDLRRRIAATKMAEPGTGAGRHPGRAAGDDAEAGPLLGEGL